MKMRGVLLIILISLLVSVSPAGNRNTYPLPEDRGTAGTLAALKKLSIYARILEITAHPDDESAGTLTWLSRNYHAQTALFSLTRGEGGQNILGSEKYSELGLVRSGELLEACKYYGTELYFGNVVDFGFSKTAEETLAKWGHDATLAEMVLFIRRWRPTVIISRFQGTAADGHGHHQAAGILTKEAFRAAADPKSFPEQLKGGLAPWQVKWLYVSAMFTPQGNPAAGMVRVPVGDYDPVLGMSWREIGMEGYSKHRTQGNGAAYAFPGRSYEYFRLEEPSANLDSFPIGRLNAIFELAGNEKQAVTFLNDSLTAAQEFADKALQAFVPWSPRDCAPMVSNGIQIFAEAIRKTEASRISPGTKSVLLDALRTKLKDFQEALNALLGIYIIARTEDVTGVPGEKVPVTVSLINRGSETVSLKGIDLVAPAKETATNANELLGSEVKPGSSVSFRYSVDILPEANPTEAYWHLEKPGDARYSISPTRNQFAPFGDPVISAVVTYMYKNTDVPIEAAARAQAGGPLRGSDFVEFQIVPPLSVTLQPDFRIAPISSNSGQYNFQVTVLNNQKGETRGTLKLESGFPVQPASTEFKLARKGESYSATFKISVPSGTKPGNYPVTAVATAAGREFRRGYHVISYPENWTRNYYFPAQSRIERFDVRVAPHLTVGYIPGAGDEVPQALEQLGINVQMLSASDLAHGDLDRFSSIITGIRAYNVNEDLRANNRRLLDYVSRGGTLVVQYVRPERSASGLPFGPYPMTVSDSDRITVEDSSVKILDPANPLFNYPNKITEADFSGWVQERGLYFMNSWDPHYKPLLSGNDPGEEPKNGGMLYTQYGKGHYIYTGYAWFRQLPAGVPGAFRIFANMLSLKK